MSNFHARIMNLQRDVEANFPTGCGEAMAYKLGHCDARRAAAEIANEADAKIAELLARLSAAEADAERYRWLRSRQVECTPHIAISETVSEKFDAAIDAARSKA